MQQSAYLHPDFIAEPLFLNWFATPFLVSPHTAACWLLYKYLPIMESYVDDPEVHEDAMHSPALLGGPFIHFSTRRIDDVAKLISRIRADAATLLDLGADLRRLDRFLQQRERGAPLEEAYREVPQSLRGLIELVYDLNNNPSIRFLESRMYDRYYERRHNTLLLHCRPAESRPFIASTPRFAAQDEIELRLAFDEPVLDVMFAMATQPGNCDELCETLLLAGTQRDQFKRFFTSQPPETRQGRTFDATGVRVRYFGHACVLLQSRNVCVLVDPFVATGTRSGVEKYTFADLPDRIDYVLLTHTHSDHACIESLLRLRHKTQCIVVPPSNGGTLADPSLKRMLIELGFKNVVELSEFDSLSVAGGTITAIPFFGEHGDLGVLSKTSFHVALEDQTYLFVADSNTLEVELYHEIRRAMGPVDTLFVGMECVGAPMSWVYGPLQPQPLSRDHDQKRRLDGSNARKAFDMVRAVGARAAFVYAMGLEPWQQHIMTGLNASDPNSPLNTEPAQFVRLCEDHGVKAKRLYGCESWRDSATA